MANKMTLTVVELCHGSAFLGDVTQIEPIIFFVKASQGKPWQVQSFGNVNVFATKTCQFKIQLLQMELTNSNTNIYI